MLAEVVGVAVLVAEAVERRIVKGDVVAMLLEAVAVMLAQVLMPNAED